MRRVVRREHPRQDSFDERTSRRSVREDLRRRCLYRGQPSRSTPIASASATACTPQTKLLMSLTSAPLPVGPRCVMFLPIAVNSGRAFEGRGGTADEKIKFARGRMSLTAGHRRIEQFSSLALPPPRPACESSRPSPCCNRSTPRPAPGRRPLRAEPHRVRSVVIRDHADDELRVGRGIARRSGDARAFCGERLGLFAVRL